MTLLILRLTSTTDCKHLLYQYTSPYADRNPALLSPIMLHPPENSHEMILLLLLSMSIQLGILVQSLTYVMQYLLQSMQMIQIYSVHLFIVTKLRLLMLQVDGMLIMVGIENGQEQDGQEIRLSVRLLLLHLQHIML